MAGHSKWKNIKHKKAKSDANRGKLFSKIAKELVVAAKLGGGDTLTNARLRLVVQKAKQANMPNDNISRAIDKGAGGDVVADYDEVLFEAYASDGVALLIETLSDNRNRTVANVKATLSKYGGRLATKGAVSYLFSLMGVVLFDPTDQGDQIMDLAVVSGAEDVTIRDDDSVEVLVSPESYEELVDAYDRAGMSYVHAGIERLASTSVVLNDVSAQSVLTLVDKLEDDDDVQAVYGNFFDSE